MSTAEKIYNILNAHRKNPYNENFESKNILEKLNYFIKNNLPIAFVFPGFHGKVNNPKFVLSPSLDMGEYVALQHIISICEKIKTIYSPGLEFHIVHEGHFYVGRTPLITSAEELDDYLSSFRQLTNSYEYIKSHSVYELIPEGTKLEEKLDTFWENYAPSQEELDVSIKQISYETLYLAYKKIHSIFFQNEISFTELSNSERKSIIKKMAVNQMSIYFGFGKLVKNFFSDRQYIRLSSLYKDPSIVDCVAINYLPNKHHMSTPTFNCLLKYKDGSYDFVKRHIAEEQKYHLINKNGLEYYSEVVE